MRTQNAAARPLEDIKIHVKLKLSALWTAFMFFYIYIDYFHLYMPGSLEDMLAGKVFTFNVSYGFLVFTLISIAIPSLMIFLSIALSPKVSRLLNILFAVLYIPYTLFNLVGGAWPHMYLGATIETILLCLIVGYAIKWPTLEIPR